MTKTYFFFLSFILAASTHAQVPTGLPAAAQAKAQQTGPSIVWQRCYGGSDNDHFRDAIATSDRGFLTSLYTSSEDGDLEGVPSPLGWVIKFDSLFNIQWQKFYSTPDCGNAEFKIIEIDSIYVFAGVGGEGCDSSQGSNDLFLMKTDLNGEIIWQRNYGSPGYEIFESLLYTKDNSFILGGESFSSGGDIPDNYGSGDAVVIKADSAGNLLWAKNFGGSAEESVIGNIVEMQRGYYIVNIVTYSNNYDLAGTTIEGRKRWIIKLDSLGNIVDENIISGDEDLYSQGGHEIIISGDKIMLAHYANPETDLFPGVEGIGGSYDGCIAVFDESLDFINMHIYGGSQSDIIYRIVQDDVSNYYLLGTSASDDFDLPGNYGNTDYWLMKTDSNFIIIWSKNFGGSYNGGGDLGGGSFDGTLLLKDNTLYAFIKCITSELPDYDIECGHSFNDPDAWIVAFDLTTEVSDDFSVNKSFKIFPNPATGILIIESLSEVIEPYSIIISDISGKEIYSRDSIASKTHHVPSFEFTNGIYFLNIISNKYTMYKEKIIIQH